MENKDVNEICFYCNNKPTHIVFATFRQRFDLGYRFLHVCKRCADEHCKKFKESECV